MPGENHDWMSLDRYLAIHERCLEDANGYFVVSHNLNHPATLQARVVRFSGVIHCHGGIEIHVNLTLMRDARNRVRGRRFRYHAQRIVPGTTGGLPHRIAYILRYDNADHFPQHPDPFHKHVFTVDGKPNGVQHIGRQNFPTLRDVIDEVFTWAQQHHDRLSSNC